MERFFGDWLTVLRWYNRIGFRTGLYRWAACLEMLGRGYVTMCIGWNKVLRMVSADPGSGAFL